MDELTLQRRTATHGGEEVQRRRASRTSGVDLREPFGAM
jgi:hypothetical protein